MAAADFQCKITSYYLTMTRAGEPCRSGKFLQPAPGLYQIISDIMFSSMLTPSEVPCSTMDNDTFFLQKGKERVAEFDLKDAKHEPAQDVNLNGLFHVTSKDGNYVMTFSAIREHEDSKEYYICCPRFEMH